MHDDHPTSQALGLAPSSLQLHLNQWGLLASTSIQQIPWTIHKQLSFTLPPAPASVPVVRCNYAAWQASFKLPPVPFSVPLAHCNYAAWQLR